MSSTSQKRDLANARNATHSTGPRSEAGKARSSRNALKHGLTSKDAVLPNEDPAAFQDTLRHWLDYYRPADPAEAATIERAVVSKWRLDRCTRVETERLSELVRHAADRYDLDRFTAAEEVGRRLIDDPINRCDTPKLDDISFRTKMEARVAHNPAVLVRQLQRTAHGVDWLLKRWGELAAMLKAHGFWHYPEKFRVLWLLGKNPEDVLDDPLAQKLFFACDAAHPDLAADPDRTNLWDECYQAKTFVDGRPAFFHHLNGLRPQRPDDAATARAQLWEIVTQEYTRLSALKHDHLDPLDRLDRAAAPERAMFDDSKEGVLLRRYESACEKEFHKSIADLIKLRKEPPSAHEPDQDDTRLQNEPVAETEPEQQVASDALPASGREPSEPAPPMPGAGLVTPFERPSGVETTPLTAL